MRYVNQHCHSEFSNIATPDVTITNEDRILRAVQLGHKVASGAEHGGMGNFFQFIDLAKKNNIKPLLGSEVYFVKDRFEKDRTNAHLLLLAKNERGRKGINRVISSANRDGYYYKARIDLALIETLPENDIWVTTACLGGIWKYDDSEEILKKLFDKFGKNLFLEVQTHEPLPQVVLNHKILSLSKSYGIPIIAGMDSHMILPEDAVKRDIYLASRGIQYPEEQAWFLDFPTYETAVERFVSQGVLNGSEISQAMENTLVFEDVDVYNSPIFEKDRVKLPTIYPTKSQEERDNVFSQLIWDKWAIEKNNVPEARWNEYEKEIHFELDTVIETGMADYFLLNYEIIKEAKKNGGKLTLTSRGSAAGFYLSRLLEFTTIDRLNIPVKLYPQRFMSKERILEAHSLPDVDFNVSNPNVFSAAQDEILGAGKAYRMITYTTVQTAGAWKMYARYANVPFDDANAVSDQIREYETAVKYADDGDTVDVYKYIEEKYWSEYENSKQFLGMVNTMSSHPCAFLLIDSGTIDEEIGLVRMKSGGDVVLCASLDGYTAEKNLFLKNDWLKVVVVELIHGVYDAIGIKPHTVTQLIDVCKGDDDVWSIYEKGIVMGINQVEVRKTAEKAMRYKPTNIAELSGFVAAIRPAFMSNYSQYERREAFSYGVNSLDSLIQTDEFPYSYLLYQELLMAVLAYAGIPLHETYQVVKSIAKKRHSEVFKYKGIFIPQMSGRLVNDEGSTIDDAKDVAEMIWQVIEDAASYSFNACVSGCTIIQRLGVTKSRFNPTVEEMFLIKNSHKYAKETGHIPLHKKYQKNGYGNALSMFDDGKIRRNKIIDIYKSGYQKVYRVETESGASIVCTANHKFPTPSGERELEKIGIGGLVYVKGEYEKTLDVGQRRFSRAFGENLPSKGQKGFRTLENSQSRLFLETRFELEKNMSPCEECGRKHSLNFELHHIDGDRTNNCRENLRWCCNSCHKKVHYKTLGRKKVYEKGIPVKIEEIVSIVYAGNEWVYDIEMEDPAHTFITDSGLVTSNSHSVSVGADSLYGAYLKSHYPLKFYETLLIIYEKYSDKDRIVLAKSEAEKFFRITFPSFKWGQDNRTIVANETSNSITMSLSTIKGFGSGIADELYELYKTFTGTTFLDLIIFAIENGLFSKAKWKQLIRINYFSSFGAGKTLEKFFDEVVGGKSRYSISHKDATKEKRLLGLSEIWNATTPESYSIRELIDNELDILGKVNTQFKGLSPRFALVLDLNTDFSPKVLLQSLSKGTVLRAKVPKKSFIKDEFKIGDVIFCDSFEEKPKQRKSEDGWEEIEGSHEWWIVYSTTDGELERYLTAP